MSSPQYFCYECNREVATRNTDLKCGTCGGEFVEELSPRPAMRMHVAGRPPGAGGNNNPMNIFLHDLLQQVAGNPAGVSHRAGPHAPAPTPAEGANVQPNPMENPLQAFINSLMGNLGNHTQGNVQIRLNINGQEAAIEPLLGNAGDYAWGAGGLDRIVTNLLNQFDAGQPEQGLIEHDMARIPVITVTQKHVDNTTQCTTCMETYKLDEPVLELNCKHIFHRDCLIPWLERHRTCPICRQEVDPSHWSSASAPSGPVDNLMDELD